MSDKIKISSYGAFDKTIDFLSGVKQRKWMKILKGYGEKGVEALREATPFILISDEQDTENLRSPRICLS